ncbi:aldo/keto reductase [Sporosarcina sp. ITBMC105]
MKKRELGKSGIYVSELSLGCMSLPHDELEGKNIIDAAIHAGINFFDTADLYSNSRNESVVGTALKGRRDKIILSTKVGNRRIPGEEGWRWDPSKSYIMEAVKDSLLRLGTDYIDLYQLHGGTMEDEVDETIDAFETLKKEGIIRQYGISSIRPTVIQRFLSDSSAVAVMMQYSILDRRPEEYFSLIANYGASLLTRGTLAKGLLTTEGLQRLNETKGFGAYELEALKETVTAIHSLTDDIHTAAIKFNLAQPIVASTVIGASTTEQLLDSINAYDKEIDQYTYKSIESLLKVHQYDQHRLN